MSDLEDGQSVEVKGSAKLPYVLRNVGGVYSCSCPAWRNQSVAIEKRTCKHLKQLRGTQAELDRIGSPSVPSAAGTIASSSDKPEGPKLLLAETWDSETDIAGWWMSEKLDGVRAWWTGEAFLSRQGNTFHAPGWLKATLPRVPLDGELWLARKSFQRTVSIVRRQDMPDSWREIRYVVFDAPFIAAPFEDRLKYLQDLLTSPSSGAVELLPQSICKDAGHLHSELDRITAAGGEGLMLRQPGSRYEEGRSQTLLKVKRFQDAEARVVEHLPGSGRHKGRLGAVLVELPDGTTFSVGSGFTDAQREKPPAIGSLITFSYQDLSDRGVPRFPTFVRARADQAAESAASQTSESL